MSPAERSYLFDGLMDGPACTRSYGRVRRRGSKFTKSGLSGVVRGTNGRSSGGVGELEDTIADGHLDERLGNVSVKGSHAVARASCLRVEVKKDAGGMRYIINSDGHVIGGGA